MGRRQDFEDWLAGNEFYAYSINALGKPYNFKNKARLVGEYSCYLLNKCMLIFDYEDMEIPKREIELSLFRRGFVCLKELERNGEMKGYALWGGLGGIPNEYYLPTTIVIANPYLKYNETLIIDEDCVLGWNDSLHIGLYPLINKYATLLAEIDLSKDIKIILSRLAYLVSAGDQNAKKSIEKVITDLYDGEVGVAIDKAILEGIKSNPLTDGGKFTEMIELEQYILTRFLNEIGLSGNYNMKRESLNSNEIQLQGDNELTLVEDMLRCREEMIDKYNKMYGKNASVHLSSLWREQRAENINIVEDDVEVERVVPLEEVNETEQPKESEDEKDVELQEQS